MTSCCRAAFWLFIRAQHHRLFATWSRRYNHNHHLYRNTLWQRLRQKDGTQIYYKIAVKTVLFSHGWLLDGDMWDSQLNYLARHSRAIAFDRRGFGRSRIVMERLRLRYLCIRH